MQIAKQEAIQIDRASTQQKIDLQVAEQHMPEIQETKGKSQEQANQQGGSNKDSMNQQQERFAKAAEKVLADSGYKADVHFNELRFAQHDKTNRMVISVVDRDTQEIVREIPSEKMLDMLAKMWDAAGLFVNESR
ncbi:hypothetical protein AN642_01310 [Epulopiscium sp. SCG-B10WGA-EpuloA2]|nr:hypothetical protein AN642_01310 [Epulopiscium sp. SCG-B10WGA-EpuloA2]